MLIFDFASIYFSSTADGYPKKVSKNTKFQGYELESFSVAVFKRAQASARASLYFLLLLFRDFQNC